MINEKSIKEGELWGQVFTFDIRLSELWGHNTNFWGEFRGGRFTPFDQ